MFSSENDVNLQGEAAKFPEGTHVCEAGMLSLSHIPSTESCLTVTFPY